MPSNMDVLGLLGFGQGQKDPAKDGHVGRSMVRSAPLLGQYKTQDLAGPTKLGIIFVREPHYCYCPYHPLEPSPRTATTATLRLRAGPVLRCEVAQIARARLSSWPRRTTSCAPSSTTARPLDLAKPVRCGGGGSGGWGVGSSEIGGEQVESGFVLLVCNGIVEKGRPGWGVANVQRIRDVRTCRLAHPRGAGLSKRMSALGWWGWSASLPQHLDTDLGAAMRLCWD